MRATKYKLSILLWRLFGIDVLGPTASKEA